MMERDEKEQTENKDGKEQPGLVARKYFAMQEVALENLLMKDVEMLKVFAKPLGMAL